MTEIRVGADYRLLPNAEYRAHKDVMPVPGPFRSGRVKVTVISGPDMDGDVETEVKDEEETRYLSVDPKFLVPLDSKAETPAENKELQDFKAELYKVAMDLAKQHDWCDVVDRALKQLGVEKPEEVDPYEDGIYRTTSAHSTIYAIRDKGLWTTSALYSSKAFSPDRETPMDYQELLQHLAGRELFPFKVAD